MAWQGGLTQAPNLSGRNSVLVVVYVFMKQDFPTLSISHLKITGKIGEGSMATVYVAQDKRLKVRRAVKVLAPHLVGSEQIRTRFTQEAQTMAGLNHTNVVSVLDVDLDASPPFIVMEYIVGGSLRNRIDLGGPLPPRQACTAVADVLSALEAAHGAGILHRDIKPENLLITAQGTVKVSDFGIAHVEDAGHSFTKTGAVLGTVGFMSPEQQRSAKGLTPQADLYAVGATLYAAVAGDKPVGLHVRQALESALTKVPETFHSWLTQACALAPGDRFESATEMKIALQKICDSLPEDPDDASPLVMDIPTPVGESVEKSTPTKWSIGTLFGQYDGAVTSGEAQYQTEWTEDKGKQPLLMALSALIVIGVLGAIVYSMMGS
jgi:serine/threonine protein kinase